MGNCKIEDKDVHLFTPLLESRLIDRHDSLNYTNPDG